MQPEWRCLTPAGTHSWPRFRSAEMRYLTRRLSRLMGRKR
jgi:hypothetical protein